MNNLEYIHFRRRVVSGFKEGASAESLENDLMVLINQFRTNIKKLTGAELILPVGEEHHNFKMLCNWLEKMEEKYKERWYHFGIFYTKRQRYKLEVVRRLMAICRLHILALKLSLHG